MSTAELRYEIKHSYDNSTPFQYLAAQLATINEVYNELIDDSLELIEAKQNILDIEIEALEKKDDEEADIFYQHIYEGGRIKNLEMKDSILHSLLIYFYSQFESALFEIVRICEKDFDFGTYSDYIDKCKKFRKGIWKAFNYIELSTGTTFQDCIDDWTELDYFRQIRNIVVHRVGVLYNNDKKLRDYISGHEHLNLFTVTGAQNRIVRYQIVITEEYSKHISRVVLKFLNKIMERIWNSHYYKGKK